MNLITNPALLERLAAAYALGTLRGGARRRLESLSRQHATIRTSVLLWQERLQALTEMQQEVKPSANVWLRIANLLDTSHQAAVDLATNPVFVRVRRALSWWRGAALTGALASVAAVTIGVKLDQQLRTLPSLEYVAVLADDQAATSMLVTFDPKHQRLTLKRVGAYRESNDRSLQLWALPHGGKPQSLGVLGSEPVIKLTAAETEIKSVPTLAISLEPKGGVPSAGGPTGPVLFKGALLETSM